jgi:hypothetical protein
LGLTQWSRHGQTVTPLMRWLDDDGVQFAYGRLLRGETPSWKHLYSSNLSMKTSLLAENPYQEIFRAYGMEDIELGYRLAKEKGLTVTFLREAVGYHLHPTDYRQTIRRAELAGAATFTFAQLWPEQRWHAPRSALKRLALRVLMEPSLVLPALTWAAGLATRLRCPNPLLKLVLGLHLRLGYQRAQRGAA